MDVHHRLVLVHSFNPSTGEAEASQSASLRSAWSTEQVPRQAPKKPCLTKQKQKQTNKPNNKTPKKKGKIKIIGYS